MWKCNNLYQEIKMEWEGLGEGLKYCNLFIY